MNARFLYATVALQVALSGAALAQVSDDAKSSSIWFNSTENKSVLMLGPENEEPSVITIECFNGKLKGIYNKYYGDGSIIRFSTGATAIDIKSRSTRIMGQNLLEFYPSNSQLSFILTETPKLAIAGRSVIDTVPKNPRIGDLPPQHEADQPWHGPQRGRGCGLPSRGTADQRARWPHA